MIDKTNKATDNRLRYRSPEVKVVFVKMQGILCQSSVNDRGEYDVTGNDPIIEPEE